MTARQHPSWQLGMGYPTMTIRVADGGGGADGEARIEGGGG